MITFLRILGTVVTPWEHHYWLLRTWSQFRCREAATGDWHRKWNIVKWYNCWYWNCGGLSGRKQEMMRSSWLLWWCKRCAGGFKLLSFCTWVNLCFICLLFRILLFRELVCDLQLCWCGTGLIFIYISTIVWVISTTDHKARIELLPTVLILQL